MRGFAARRPLPAERRVERAVAAGDRGIETLKARGKEYAERMSTPKTRAAYGSGGPV